MRNIEQSRAVRLVAVLAMLATGFVLVQGTAAAIACTSQALIDAINQANGATNATIELPSKCAYTLTNPYQGSNDGLPAITGSVTIQGNGSTIRRTSAIGTPEFGLIAVSYGADLALNQVTVTGGLSASYGGIFNSGTLTIVDSSIRGNRVHDGSGGGIHNDETATLTLANSDVTGNIAVAGGGAGIHNDDGSVTLTDSTVSGNIVRSTGPNGLGGGGIQTLYGAITLINSAVSDNRTYGATDPIGGGGGILNVWGLITLTQSTISGNSAPKGYGGGVFNYYPNPNIGIVGGLIATDSIVRDNSAEEGGGIANWSTVTLTSCTISDNTAFNTGGGIENGANSTLTNSTVSGNKALIQGGGVSNTSHVTLINNTISNNRALVTGGGIMTSGPYGNTTLGNTIAAGNRAIWSSNVSGTLTDLGHNLVTGDPHLGPLANYGGPTLTMALLLGSPALNAGDDSMCASPPPGGAGGIDQRGVTRPQGAHCDIGAFELRAPARQLAPGS